MNDQTNPIVVDEKAEAQAALTEARKLIGLPAELLIGDRTISVRSYGWPQLFEVLAAAQPILDAMVAEPSKNLFNVLGDQKPHVALLVSLSTDLTVAEIEKLGIRDSMRLAYAVWDENEDFFLNELKPMLAVKLKLASELKTAKSSSSGGPTSNQADEASPSPEPAGQDSPTA